MQTEGKIKISELKPHPMNDYYFDDMEGQKWKEFLESVKTSGIIEPIVITQDRTIVSGHQRVRACKELGIDSVNVEVRIYDDEDMIIKDLIETNLRQRGTIGGSMEKTTRISNELQRLYGVRVGSANPKGTKISSSASFGADATLSDVAKTEVKADNIIGKTGNVLLELATIRNGKRSEGWFFSPYDRMAYIDSRNQIAYMLDYQKMSNEINIDDFTRRTINNDNGNQGEVVLVSLKDIAAHGWIYDRWDYTSDEWERIEKIYDNYDKQNSGWLGLADTGAA